MNLQTYLMIKQSSARVKLAEETFDPSKHLSGKDLETYNNYIPKDIKSYASDGYTANITAGDESTGPIMPNVADPKARRFTESYFGSAPLRDDQGNTLKNDKGEERKGTHYRYTDYSTNPYLNLHYGDDVDAVTGNIVKVLQGKGYGGADLRGMRLGKTIGIDSIMDENGNYAGEGKPTGTIYIDDAGNILDRSKGIVYGRRTGKAIGAVGGGIGGGYLGYKGTDWLNKKLGLTDDKGDVRKWLGRGLRAVGTVGGAAAGAYGGGWAGSRLGSSVGGLIDPQKGRAIRFRAVNG